MAEVIGVLSVEDVTAHVAQRLREARAACGWSQEQLAKACGWTQAAVSLYESGQRRVGIYELCELARALDRPLWFFLDDLPSGDTDPGPLGDRRPGA